MNKSKGDKPTEPIGIRIERCLGCGKSFGISAPHWIMPKHECKPTKEWKKELKRISKEVITMYGCRIGDRIVCKCDEHPDCIISDMKLTVKCFDFEDQRMWMVDDNKSVEAYCTNHPYAKIEIIKRAE